MRARIRTILGLALGAGIALTACGRFADSGAGSGGSPSPSPSRAPDELVLRVETGGEFVPVSRTRGLLPEFSLMADGRVITQGPQIEIYPSPALPNLQVRTLTPDGIRAVVEAARAAGLDGPDRTYDDQNIADAPTTTFTFVDQDGTHVVSVYALDLGGSPVSGGSNGDEAEARQQLSALRSDLFDLERWLPPGSVGEESGYRFDEARVFVLEPAAADQGLSQEPVDWPLSDPLSTFGEPVADQPSLRCGTVSGADLEQLRPLFEGANELTPWRSEGKDYQLVLRPLLPDESGC